MQARTLRPGGVFVNGDKYALNSIREHKKSLQKQIEQFDVFERVGRPDLKEEWTKHYLEDEEVKITESEQESILKELGFTNIETTYRAGMEAIIVAEKQHQASSSATTRDTSSTEVIPLRIFTTPSSAMVRSGLFF